MKKSLLALAVLGVFAGGALAQSSSVTLGGIVDLNARSVKNGSNDALRTMNSDGINSSRLYFRGTEDLGGGMSAGFWLEAGMANDSGNVGGSIGTAAPTNGSSNFFNRRSTVSLMGGWGEIRLGRDYTSGFWNTTVFDPFGTNGVGAFTNVSINALGTTTGGNTSYVRSNNTFGYFLPGNLGGLYGQAQQSLAEAPANGNKQTSVRLGYAAGPINVAVSAQTTKTTPADWKHNNIAGSYNFGVANLMVQYDTQKSGSRKQATWLLGAVVPLGQGELHLAYDKADQSGPTAALEGADANQIAIGYVYNLSKRTALYGTYARISNDNSTAAFAIGGGFGSAANAKSTGYEVGLRHAF